MFKKPQRHPFCAPVALTFSDKNMEMLSNQQFHPTACKNRI